MSAHINIYFLKKAQTNDKKKKKKKTIATVATALIEQTRKHCNYCSYAHWHFLYIDTVKQCKKYYG